MSLDDDARWTGDDDGDRNLDRTYLSFSLEGTEYALPVAHVTEIVCLPKSYAIPDLPAYVPGVINLRGRVVPLIDVRTRLGLEREPYRPTTVVVVLDLGTASAGLVVDAVSEVIDIDPVHVELLAVSVVGGRASMIRALGKRESGVCLIVDVDALVAGAVPHSELSRPHAALSAR